MYTVSRARLIKDLHKNFAEIVELYAELQEKLIDYLPKLRVPIEQLVMSQLMLINFAQIKFLIDLNSDPITNPNLNDMIIGDIQGYISYLIDFSRRLSIILGDNGFPGGLGFAITKINREGLTAPQIRRINKLSKDQSHKIYKLLYKIIEESYEYLYDVIGQMPSRLTPLQKTTLNNLISSSLDIFIQYFRNVGEDKLAKKLKHLKKELLEAIARL